MQYTWEYILSELGYDPEKRSEIKEKLRLHEIERERDSNAAWAYLGIKCPAVCKWCLQDHVDDVLSEFVKTGQQLSLEGFGLIVTDRLYGWGIALQYFLVKCMGMEAAVVTSYQEALEAVNGRRPQLLLYVGYQENEENYRLIDELRADHPTMILWAMISLKTAEVVKNHSELTLLDRSMPLNYLASHLQILQPLVKGAQEYYDSHNWLWRWWYRRQRRNPPECVRPWERPGS